MSTTFAAIRTEQVALIRAITPSSLASVSFVAALDERNFRDWADANPTACFRRFSIRDRLELEPPDVSNADVEWTGCREEILVAYPLDYRYGEGNQRDLESVLREDLYLLDDQLGPYGYDNYSAAVATDLEVAAETMDNVVILVLSYRLRYYRDVNAQSYTAMQTSAEQSFQYTAATATDSYTVTIPKAMVDTSYVVEPNISAIGSGGATCDIVGVAATTTTLTLTCGASLAIGTVIDIIVRDR